MNENKFYYFVATVMMNGRVARLSSCLKGQHPLVWAKNRTLAKISAGDGFPDGPTNIDFFSEIPEDVYVSLMDDTETSPKITG